MTANQGAEAMASTGDDAVDGPLAELYSPANRERPLCVALDGGLIATRTAWEGLFRVMRHAPWSLFWLPFWLLSGVHHAAAELARRARLDPAALPYHKPLVSALRRAAELGRPLTLLGGGLPGAAQAAAQHLGVFDEVLDDRGDSASVIARRFGDAPFDFVAGEAADLPACERATRAYLVHAAPGLVRRANGNPALQVVTKRPAVVRAAIAELRPHQWAKNALVFVPLLLSPELPTPQLVLRAVIATAMFSLVASSGYVLNDLLDLDADRVHATKHRRPFASGALPIPFGPPMFLGLVGCAFGVSVLTLPPLFTLLLAVYFVATVSYSLWLKQQVLIDVLLLAGLYTHRVFSGGAATGIPISSWLLAFSMFLFLSLAFAKRYIELRATQGTAKLKSRGYSREDISVVGQSGIATGYMAVLVFALYIEGPDVSQSYRAPQILWAACPVLIYWIGHIWFSAHRGTVEDDPVRFALRDRKSWLCALAVGLVAALARFGPILWA